MDKECKRRDLGETNRQKIQSHRQNLMECILKVLSAHFLRKLEHLIFLPDYCRENRFRRNLAGSRVDFPEYLYFQLTTWTVTLL